METVGFKTRGYERNRKDQARLTPRFAVGGMRVGQAGGLEWGGAGSEEWPLKLKKVLSKAYSGAHGVMSLSSRNKFFHLL